MLHVMRPFISQYKVTPFHPVLRVLFKDSTKYRGRGSLLNVVSS